MSSSNTVAISDADREIVADALHRYFQSVWAAGGDGRAVLEQALRRSVDHGGSSVAPSVQRKPEFSEAVTRTRTAGEAGI